MTKLIDGIVVKNKILKKIKENVRNLKEKTNQTPGLAVIVVGSNPASKAYIAMKEKACQEVGIRSQKYQLAPEQGQEELEKCIEKLNQDQSIHGILLQLPLPKEFDEQKMLQKINPNKDVDGFHPINMGKLLIGLDGFKPCTPQGICELLNYYKIETSGKHVVVVGRSNIVGKPIAAMLSQKSNPGNATVTICHSKSQNLSKITTKADILIAAIGKPQFIKKEHINTNTIVIDVGINRVENSKSEKGYELVGDVDFENVKDSCQAITPVPGGVGPLTIAILLKNTLVAFEKKLEK